MTDQHNQMIQRMLITTGIFFVIHLTALLVPGPFQWVDTRVYTFFFRLRHFFHGEEEVSPYILLFSLDNKFEKKFPTPGKEKMKMAESLDTLREAGVRTILFDIIYRERDTTPVEDTRLAQSVRAAGNVFLPCIVNRNIGTGKELPAFLAEKLYSLPGAPGQGKPATVGMGITPFPALCRAASGLGGITLFPESDGIVHRVPLVYSLGGKLIPSMVLAGICHYFQVSPETVSITFGKYIILPHAHMPGGDVRDDLVIPVDHRGQLIINFTGPWKTSVTSYSLENLLSPFSREDTDKLGSKGLHPGNLVLIGDMTTTSKDISRGIFEENYPMAGILHSGLNTILTGNYLYEPGTVEKILVSVIVLVILFLAGLLLHDSLRSRWLLIVLFLYLVISYGFFVVAGRLPAVTLHTLGCILTGIILFRLEVRAIRNLIKSDDALTVPDTPGKVSSPEPVFQTIKPKIQLHLSRRMEEMELSSAQREVALLLIGGLQYKEIAYKLGISTTAVGRRINRIYQKFGINNKIEFMNKVYGN